MIALWTWFFVRGIGDADYSVAGTGVMPVAFIFAGSTLAMIVGSLLTRPPAPERTRRFIP